MKKIAVTLICGLVSCSFLQKNVKDPAVNLYRRGSCVSIDIPAITLTPSRTAAERQLIGEDREIEKDGWLLASARSTTRPQDSGSLQESRRAYRELAVLEFYQDPLREYARAGILGENGDDGKVALVPENIVPRTGRFRSPEELDAVRKTADEINRSRSYLLQYYLKREKERPSGDPASFEKAYRRSFLADAKTGEWTFVSGAWTRQK